jgi:hypothetical protein
VPLNQQLRILHIFSVRNYGYGKNLKRGNGKSMKIDMKEKLEKRKSGNKIKMEISKQKFFKC